MSGQINWLREVFDNLNSKVVAGINVLPLATFCW